MSLLDDVSIVVTPNGYKAGELYAVIPVPTEGSELVTDGDFSQEGAEKVTNGDFSANSGWNNLDSNGWRIDTETSTLNFTDASSYVFQGISTVSGKSYKVTLDIELDSGTITVKSFASQNIITVTSTGRQTVTGYFKESDGNANIGIQTLDDANGKIHSISVKEVGAAWALDSSFSISSGLFTQNGTAGRTYQSISALESGLGTYIKVTFTVEAISSGQFHISCYGVSSPVVTTTGTYTFTGVTSNTTNLYVNNGGYYANGSISNISVKTFLSADMDVTRATAATRVDENGLVNYAEVIGGEEVTNGDFATDSDWTKGAGWTISGGSASHTGGASYLIQDVLQANTLYKVNISVTAVSGGGFIQIYMGNSPASVLISQIGDYIYYFTSQSSVSVIGFGLRSIGDVTIDNISVKQVTRDNVPRIDYTGGGCPHILAEPQRTNLVTNSTNLNGYFTSQVDATLTDDYGISPTGDNNSTRVQWADSTSFAYRTVSISTDTSASIFVKGTSGETVMFGFGGNVTTGDIYTFDGSWQRITFTGSTGTTIFLSSYGGATATDFQAFGLQLEEGSYATSYIPTSGSTVTRNQDIFTRDGIGSLINSEEGVLFVEFENVSGTEAAYKMISISDGSAANRIGFFVYAGQISAESSGSGTNLGIYSKALQSGFNKIAIKYKVNDCALWVNGTEYVDTNFAEFSSSTFNSLVFDRGDNAFNFNGKVKQLQVYDTALTDDQLLQLTGESGTDFYESYAEMASALNYTIQ